MRRSMVIRAVTVLVGLNLAGCGTLMNPYVSPKAVGNSWQHTLPYDGKSSLPEARTYAGAYAETYRAAAADHAIAKNALGVGLIGLNTIGLIKGATSPADGSDLLPIIGFGSAGALSIGGLLISSPRQAIYLEGQQAMLCARSRSNPYVNDGDAEALLKPDTGFAVRHERLRQLVELAKADRAAALPAPPTRSATPTPQETAAVKAYEDRLARNAWLGQRIDEANGLLALATPVRQDLEAYVVRRKGAALRLYTDVGLIAAATDREVQRTEPNVSDIRNALSKSSLASTLELPAPAPAPQPVTPPGAEGLQAAAPTPPNLAPAHLELAAEIQQMKQVLPAASVARDRLLAAEQTASGSEDCLAAGLVLVEALTAPTTALVAGKGELLIAVKLRARKDVLAPPPTVSVVGQPAGLTVQLIVVDPALRTYQVRLAAGDKVAAGTYTLLVTADDVKSVAFQVTAAPVVAVQAGGQGGGGQGGGGQAGGAQAGGTAGGGQAPSTSRNPDGT